MIKKKTESQIKREIFLAIGSKPTCRIFNNPIGYDKERKIKFGLVAGSSDLIGLHSTIITPDDVGKRFAKFVAIEVKRLGGKPTQEQKNFIDMVNWLGGSAGIATSVEEAEGIVNSGGIIEHPSK